MIKINRFYFISVIILVIILEGSCKRSLPETTLYKVFEISLKANDPGKNPYTDGPQLSAVFTGVSDEAKGLTYRIQGFWDGDNVWKIRFAPIKAGKWEYKTESTDAGLGNKKGSFIAVLPSAEQLRSNILFHGFLEPADTFSWKLSDGTPFLPVGETQWSFSEEFTFPEWKDWMNAISVMHYNTFMGCAWLGKFTRVDLIPFENRDPSSDRLLVGFFKNQLDSMVRYANDKGIMMGLVIGGFPDNTQWFSRFKTIERCDRWFRYIIARYGALNVRWGLFGELDEAIGKNALENKTWKWAGDHYAQLVKAYDPYKHPVGSHNTRVDYNAAANPDIDFVEVQEGSRVAPDQYLNAIKQRKWNKPVWYEEYWYEYDGDQDVGIQNTHRNFIHALAFPTMGSLMRTHFGANTPFAPDEAKKNGQSLYDYLMKNDTGMIRMSYFADFYKVLTRNLTEFSPAGNLVDKGECGRFGKNFAVFLDKGGIFTIDLSNETAEYNVIKLDVKKGDSKKLKSIKGGQKCIIDTESVNSSAILILNEGD